MDNNIFNINSSPIYGIEINKIELVDSLPYAKLESDLFSMMNEIKDAINSTKPSYIDINNIVLSNPKHAYDWDNPTIYLSGKDMNRDMISFIMKLWIEMIRIYKVENLNQKYEDTDIFNSNHILKAEYLKKITTIYWLDWLALDEIKISSKKEINKV